MPSDHPLGIGGVRLLIEFFMTTEVNGAFLIQSFHFQLYDLSKQGHDSMSLTGNCVFHVSFLSFSAQFTSAVTIKLTWYCRTMLSTK